MRLQKYNYFQYVQAIFSIFFEKFCFLRNENTNLALFSVQISQKSLFLQFGLGKIDAKNQ